MKKHILLVEDNLDIRDTLIPMLEIWLEDKPWQADIHEADHGEQALQWIEAHGEPDWILLDVRMPVMNGAAFLQRMSTLGKDISKKTLLLTGYADDLDEYLGNNALVLPHLRKPFMAAELFEALDILVGE